MNNLNYLKQFTKNAVSHIPHSRIHALNTFNFPQATCKIKRDDELGFGVSGSKLRKYTSLMPHILQNQYRKAFVIGSAYSNHVLCISQLLIENRIEPLLFLLGSPPHERKGNLLLTSLLVPASQQHWISRKDWPEVEAIAAGYAGANQDTILIPEGACMAEALPGALTLALDIIENELEDGTPFDHVFMDAGTGFSAIATILAFAWLRKKTILHVLMSAGNEEEFLLRLKRFQINFEQLSGCGLEWKDIASQFKLHRPTQARSFGSVNKTIMNHIQFLAREEGFFTDPVYSAKLFFESKKIIPDQRLKGNILIIHSGGALTLMGFEDSLNIC